MSETADRVKKIVVEHLGVEADKVTEDASFIDDLGADSLDIVELVMAFEEEFGVEIPDDAAEKITTVRDAITYIDEQGVEQHPTIRVLSERPEENDWLAVNQVTVRDREHHRRFDVVLYVNGMPLGMVELKRSSADDETAAAHAQVQTYVRELPMAFRFTVFVIFSNGQTAKYGTPRLAASRADERSLSMTASTPR